MNIDLLRDILLRLRGSSGEFTITGYEEEQVHLAAELLQREGYIHAATSWIPGQSYKYVMPRGLTEEGEELVRRIEDDLVWDRVKEWLSRSDKPSTLATIEKLAAKMDRMRN